MHTKWAIHLYELCVYPSGRHTCAWNQEAFSLKWKYLILIRRAGIFFREGHRRRRENKWKLDTQDSWTPLRWPLSQGLNIISEVAGEVIPSCVRESELHPGPGRPQDEPFVIACSLMKGRKKKTMEDGHRICFASPYRTIGAWRHGWPLNHLSALTSLTRSKKMLH